MKDGEVEEFLRVNMKRVLDKQVGSNKKRKMGGQSSSGATSVGAVRTNISIQKKESSEDVQFTEEEVGNLTPLHSDAGVPSSSPPAPPPSSSFPELPKSIHSSSDSADPFQSATTTSGQIMSCDVAAQIVANLRNDLDLDEARAAVGCVSGTSSCSVKNMEVLNILDEAL